MKKLLMGAIVLSLFAISLCLVQISCSKSNAQQNTPLDNSQLNKIVFIKLPNPNTGQVEIWTANFDGTSAAQVPIVMPSGMGICATHGIAQVRLSPDGQNVFFAASSTGPNPAVWSEIYACNIDGSNVRPIVPGSNTAHIVLGGSY